MFLLQCRLLLDDDIKPHLITVFLCEKKKNISIIATKDHQIYCDHKNKLSSCSFRYHTGIFLESVDRVNKFYVKFIFTSFFCAGRPIMEFCFDVCWLWDGDSSY